MNGFKNHSALITHPSQGQNASKPGHKAPHNYRVSNKLVNDSEPQNMSPILNVHQTPLYCHVQNSNEIIPGKFHKFT